MPRNISAALKAHYAQGTTTIATCWKATLTDGTVVAATTHCERLVIGGLAYEPTDGYNPSDVQNAADLSVDNLEVNGVLRSPSIQASDLHTGRWDYAAIELFEVNYNDLSMGRNLLRSGRLGQVKAGTGTFSAELRGLTQAYSRTIVQLVSKECRADLGDSMCRVALAPLTATDIVSLSPNRRTFSAVTFASLPANYFTGGKVAFTSGANAGLSMEVKLHPAPEGAYFVELFEPMPFDIAPSDGFTVSPGCQKRLTEDCKTKFNNVRNFQGEPYLPQSDVFATPA